MVGPVKATTPQKAISSTTTRTQTRSLLALSDKIANLTTDTGALREYIANIQVDPTSLGGSFNIYLFDEPVNDDSSNWSQYPGLLGYHFFMVNEKTGTQRRSTSQSVAGAVTLTSTLMGRVQRGVLGGMSNEEVEGYLRERMVWKGVKVSSPPSLLITINH
jgi:hypothetical protein